MRSKENLTRLEIRMDEMEAQLAWVTKELAEMKEKAQTEKAETGPRKKAAAKK